jgi:hypothetical protein
VSMPKAPVDKYGDSPSREYDIRATGQAADM